MLEAETFRQKGDLDKAEEKALNAANSFRDLSYQAENTVSRNALKFDISCSIDHQTMVPKLQSELGLD